MKKNKIGILTGLVANPPTNNDEDVWWLFKEERKGAIIYLQYRSRHLGNCRCFSS